MARDESYQWPGARVRGGDTRSTWTNDTYLYFSRPNRYEQVCCGVTGGDQHLTANLSDGTTHGGALSHAVIR